MGVIDEDQESFLRSHKWAVLATGRGDGSPQVSLIGYVWDGEALLVSVRSTTAKWKNVLRQPRVALVIHEDHKQLIVYGRAEAISDDPERVEHTRAIFEQLTGKPVEASDDFRAGLDQQKRTILRIVPQKAMMND